MSEDKMMYMVNFGIAPHFKSILVDEVKRSPYYVISFDESMKSIAQECQLDLIIRYWDDIDQLVKTWYWNSDFIGHSTAADHLRSFFGEYTILRCLENYTDIYGLTFYKLEIL